VAPAFRDFFASGSVINGDPLADHAEVCLNLQQLLQYQRFRLADRFFDREDSDEVIANPQMIAFGFNIRIGNLVIEEMAASR